MSERIVNDYGETVATVTVSRTVHMDITCEFRMDGSGWVLSESVDEVGRSVALTDAERLLALSLVLAGADETGV